MFKYAAMLFLPWAFLFMSACTPTPAQLGRINATEAGFTSINKGAAPCGGAIPGAGTILSATAAAACAAQAGDNAVHAIAMAKGQMKVAFYASQASQAVGVACAW